MVELPIKLYVEKLLKTARAAARPLSYLDGPIKTQTLLSFAQRLEDQEETILEANRQDVDQVGKSLEGEGHRDRVREAVERVTLTSEDVQEMAASVRHIAELPDPVGETPHMWTRPNGMLVSRVRVPIGVIAVISDFGPPVAVESLSLCLKSGNVCVLRTHPDWSHTNQVIFSLFREALEEGGVPSGAVTLIDRPEREAALELLKVPKLVDAVIPRGAAGLKKIVTDQARMPVLCNDAGVCSIYVDGDADLPMAQNIVANSKAQRTTAPNSVDTLLVHKNIARPLLPGLTRRMLDDYKVEVRGCPETMALTGTFELPSYKSTVAATDADWGQQFLAPILAVKVVDDMDEALDHIAQYGPAQTVSIVTRDYATALRFTQQVDASTVGVNASTRLSDSLEFGQGGQMGLSTARVHARGPVALEELTCEKYVILGTGQLRQPHPVPVVYEDAIMLKKGMG